MRISGVNLFKAHWSSNVLMYPFHGFLLVQVRPWIVFCVWHGSAFVSPPLGTLSSILLCSRGTGSFAKDRPAVLSKVAQGGLVRHRPAVRSLLSLPGQHLSHVLTGPFQSFASGRPRRASLCQAALPLFSPATGCSVPPGPHSLSSCSGPP